jgi:glycosyltransferase involved in cell wall biosynthesis
VRPLVVSHTGHLAGSTQVLLSLVRNRPAGASPLFVFLTDGDAVRAARDHGAEAIVIPAGRTRELWRAPGIVARLARAARAHRSDVVFSHVAKAQVYGGAAAALRRLPAIWYQHERPGEPPGAQRLAALVRCDAVFANSVFTAAVHRERWPRADVRVLHPGVQVGSATPVADHERRAGARLVVVSRLRRPKRIELAIRALAPMVARDPAITLTVIGPRSERDADYPAELARLARELGVEASVTFRGYVAGAADYMAEFDVLVHPSRREPFGLVAAEALARAVPVVAAPEGGTAEIVRDGVDGFLRDPVDSEGFAEAVMRLAADPALRARMGAAGRERVFLEFSDTVTSARTWSEVEKVVADHRARGGLAEPQHAR